jgi:hypothetical protein
MNEDLFIETTIKTGLGMLGALTSWNLAMVNQWASLAVATLTAVYLVIQIAKALDNGDRDVK